MKSGKKLAHVGLSDRLFRLWCQAAKAHELSRAAFLRIALLDKAKQVLAHAGSEAHRPKTAEGIGDEAGL